MVMLGPRTDLEKLGIDAKTGDEVGESALKIA